MEGDQSGAEAGLPPTSSATNNEEEETAAPTKHYILPKRKRKLSKHLNSKTDQKASSKPTGASQASDSDPTVDDHAAFQVPAYLSQGSKRVPTKSELMQDIKKCTSSNAALQKSLTAKERQIQTLSRKYQSLVVTVEKANEERRSAKAATKAAENQVKALGDTLSNRDGQHSQAIDSLHKSWQTKMATYESKMTALHEQQLAKAQDQRERHVSVAVSQKQRAMQKEINAIVKQNKNYKEIISHNTRVASSAQVEISKLKRSHQEALDEKDIRHRERMKKQKTQHSTELSARDNQIKSLRKTIEGYHDLLDGMSTEHSEAMSGQKRASQALTSTKEQSNKRLQRYKAALTSNEQLRDAYEAMKDDISTERFDMIDMIQSYETKIETLEDINRQLNVDLSSAVEQVHLLMPHTIAKTGKPRQWDHVITQLVLEWLANKTPPSAISKNLITAAELLIPNTPIVKELPHISFVRGSRAVLACVTKTLAAYVVASSDVIEQLFTDGTNRRQTPLNNVILKVKHNGVSKNIALDTCIIAVNETAESIKYAVLQCFKDCSLLLDHWRSVTATLYPSRPELVEMIPPSSDLNIAKLGKGSGGNVMTDTCNGAKKLQRLIIEEVKAMAVSDGVNITDEQLVVRSGVCWQHLRNIWFEGAKKWADAFMQNLLKDDLEALPRMYRFNVDIVDLLRCGEKMFGGNCNYHKGKGSDFDWRMKEKHPDAYLFPLERALGGARQDLCAEGSPAVLMNIPYYIEFLNRECGKLKNGPDGILATKLYVMLRSKEIVAYLRVMSILHISIVLPTRWLAGNCETLSEYDFGYHDMCIMVDAMDNAFQAIRADSSLILDEEFMMEKIFSEISSKVDPFKAYLEYSYGQKLSATVGGGAKVKPYEILREMLFNPSRRDVVGTDALTCEIAQGVANAFLTEFYDPRKSTSAYVNSIGGEFSRNKISEDDRKAGMGKEASNSISESNHACSTDALKTCGTIRLDYMAAHGQSTSNHDWDRDINFFIGKKRGNRVERNLGTFHTLPKELQHSLIEASKKYSLRMKTHHDVALRKQKAERLEREEIAAKLSKEKQHEKYLKAVQLLNKCRQFGWKSVGDAWGTYKKLPSEPARKKAVKEQITMRVEGCGWVDAKHAWSKDNRPYTSYELLTHFVKVILPMVRKRDLPLEPPLERPVETVTLKLGTVTDETMDVEVADDMAEINNDAMDRFEMSREKQPEKAPGIDESLIGFHIEFCFTYVEDDGSTSDDWCDGIVQKIVNARTRVVEIKWNENKVDEGDLHLTTTRQKLLLRNWNPETPTDGAWRQFIDVESN